MDKNDTIQDGKVVLFHYTLTTSHGEEIDSSRGGGPLPYLHGAGNIVPGLERQMQGRQVGDRFTAVVSPEDGYGEHNGKPPKAVPLDELPEGISPGTPLMAEMPNGERFAIWITEINEEEGNAYVTRNHPLAGVELHFDVEVAEIREATEEEMMHGHPHGPDGHGGHDHDHDHDEDDQDSDDQDYEA